MPRLGANRVLDRLAARAQRGIELATEIGCGRMFPRALQQPDHERRMDLRRPALPTWRRRLQRVNQPIGVEPMGAAGREDVPPGSQMLDERQLQRGRPRPQLAHGQGSDRLECRDEAMHPLCIEPARAQSDQLERHRVDPGQSRKLVRRDPRKPTEESDGQVVTDVAKGGEHEVKVVEQPLGGG